MEIIISDVFKKIPNCILWKHILPELEINDYRVLFQKALKTNDHNFINNYIIPSYTYRCINLKYTNDLYESHLCKCEILCYMISNFDICKIREFINIIKFKKICSENFDSRFILWTVIVKKNDPLILEYFIDSCSDCACDALDFAIDNNCKVSILYILNLDLNKNLSFTHYLKIILLKDNNLLNYLLNLLDSNEIIRANIYNNGVSYLNYILQSIEIGNDIDIDDLIYDISIGIKSNKKEAKKMKKQLRRLQKAMRLPGIVNIISNYYKDINYIEMKNNEILFNDGGDEYGDL